jgi:insertion element IS1 protein InsB
MGLFIFVYQDQNKLSSCVIQHQDVPPLLGRPTLGTNIKKNGFTNYLKQCHKCKDCKYKFVDKVQDWFISPDKKVIIKLLLLERISLRGICRVMDISMSWLLQFIKEIYSELPDDLNCKINLKKVKYNDRYYIKLFVNEADKLWSWVKKRDNVYYVWLVMHKESRQIIAFHVGDRSGESSKNLWEKYPHKSENMVYSTPMIGTVIKPSLL